MRTWLSLSLSLPLVLAACAAFQPAPSPPLLKLLPAALGRELAMAQQLVVRGGGKELALDVALEADAVSVRMAVLQFGRTLARLEWDGRQLTRTLAPGWTDAGMADRVLNDLQLVWWPASAIRSALPTDWNLTETATQRMLSYRGRSVMAITLPGAHLIVVDHILDGYTVRVQTDEQSPMFDTKP